MKETEAGDKKFKVMTFSRSEDFEQQLNRSEEDGWKLHSWTFCDNSYSVSYVALFERAAGPRKARQGVG